MDNFVTIRISACIRPASDRDEALRAMRSLLDEILRMGEYMQSRTEDDPDLSEEDKFLVLAFEDCYPVTGNSSIVSKWHRDTIQTISADYPDLVFILDQRSNDEFLNFRRHYSGGKLRGF